MSCSCGVCEDRGRTTDNKRQEEAPETAAVHTNLVHDAQEEHLVEVLAGRVLADKDVDIGALRAGIVGDGARGHRRRHGGRLGRQQRSRRRRVGLRVAVTMHADRFLEAGQPGRHVLHDGLFRAPSARPRSRKHARPPRPRARTARQTSVASDLSLAAAVTGARVLLVRRGHDCWCEESKAETTMLRRSRRYMSGAPTLIPESQAPGRVYS